MSSSAFLALLCSSSCSLALRCSLMYARFVRGVQSSMGRVNSRSKRGRGRGRGEALGSSSGNQTPGRGCGEARAVAIAIHDSFSRRMSGSSIDPFDDCGVGLRCSSGGRDASGEISGMSACFHHTRSASVVTGNVSPGPPRSSIRNISSAESTVKTKLPICISCSGEQKNWIMIFLCAQNFKFSSYVS